jgi:AcrR family transcriptional regulator
MTVSMPAVTMRRPRDASATRTLLLQAAMRRFTIEGYATTTVRQIADDAGVNVALISRYFRSKEGLFEACLAEAAQELRDAASSIGPDGDVRHEPSESDRPSPRPFPVERLAALITRQAVGTAQPNGPTHALLLILRSSGDPVAERMRLAMLHSFSEKIAEIAGFGRDGNPVDLQLRAQVVLATAVGIAVLRSSGGLEPLTAAGPERLLGPIGDLVDAVLGSELTGP